MGFNEFLSSIFGNKSTRDMKEIKPWVEKIKAAYPEVEKLDNDALRAKTEELKKYIHESATAERAKVEELKASIETLELEDREEVFAQIDKTEKEILEKYEKALDEVLPVAFSIVKATAKRFTENQEIVVTATDFDRQLAATKDFVRIEGDKAIYQNHWIAGGNDTVWNMVHYDVQLFGGVVLHKGKIAEMATGEGKTLVATLPVFLNALTGNGVHVVTVNDYLAKRDSEWMGPLYMFHGLSVDCIDRHQPNSDARRQAYLADITFGTNNEFGFDYLRDNMAISPKDLVQRQHNYAIVDEVDSVLIDDARTPLIISGPVPKGDDQLFGQLTELKVLSFGTHSETVSGRLFGDEELTPDMSEEKKHRIRMHYKKMFLDYDQRLNLSDLLQDAINRNPEMKPIKKDSRISLKDTQIGNLTNRITFISKAIQRLTKLQIIYFANSPFTYDNIAVDWEDANSDYAKQYENEELSWSNLKDLTDVELYNCPNMTQLPDFLYDLPELQSLNIACNRGISAAQLKADWTRLADDEDTGPKIQIFYMGYNNLEEYPASASLQKMVKLGLLDCVHNKVRHLEAFGTNVKLTDLKLDYNQIEEIPEDFCAFTDQVEGLGFSHNKLKYIPNIFNAKSVYVMGSVDFSYNKIGSEGRNISCSMDDYKGINASTVTLSYNEIQKFPTELFATGSPISTIILSNNLMTSIPENSLKPKDGNYKNTYLLTTIDLRFNKLTSLSDDFRATTLPYLSNMDVSYNCFSSFPTQPLNSSQLKAFGIRHQRDAEGNRILRQWPTGITTCPSLIQLQIGSNDIRKVDEKLTPQLYILDIADNPNISIDVTSVCPYIEAGMYVLLYDKTQDIRGCDALGIER